MTVSTDSIQGTRFRRKIVQFIKPKCHALLLDSQINSLETVLFNLYQILLIAAIKFYCHAKDLPRSAVHNAPFFVDAVIDVIDHVIYFATTATRGDKAKQEGCRFEATREQIYWYVSSVWRWPVSDGSRTHSLAYANKAGLDELHHGAAAQARRLL